MRYTFLILLAFLISINCPAQQLKYNAFTVNDGLPSNCVYRCVEDNKGFLWVATDAGIARFDGKHFQVFTTKDGLPDNDVLAVLKENNGRIWVNCFKQSPAYFDEVQNKFINAKADSKLARVKESSGVMYSYPLKGGGIMYVNGNGSFIFRDQKLISYNTSPANESFLIKDNNDGTLLKWGYRLVDPSLKILQLKIYQTKGNKNIDSIYLKSVTQDFILPVIDDGKLYNFYPNENKCLIYSNINCDPIRFKIDSLSVPEPISYLGFTDTFLNFYSRSGKIYVYNKQTLRKEFIVSGNYAPNSLFNDSRGNIWVCTVDKGLIMYRKNPFNEIYIPDNFTHTNFFSIARKPDGTLLAGNYYGEVIEAKRRRLIVNKSSKKGNNIFRLRKILLSQNKTFTFSDAGNYVNYSRQIIVPAFGLFYGKTAIKYSDSIILVGNVGYIEKLNTITEKVTLLHTVVKRVTALAKAVDGMVYYGSTDGLYKYSYKKDTAWALTGNGPLLSERVMALSTTADGLVWIATANNGIVVLNHDKVIGHITVNNGIINNSSRSITAGGPGQIWLGTAEGINVIKYKLRNSTLSYTVQNLSVNDGLTDNTINEMLYQDDSVYAATGNGISIIPINISIPKFNIPVQLIHLNINQRDTILAANYTLGYNQQNIQMRFAGIELGGHLKNFQYSIDKNKNWINLNESTLALQLSGGYHTVQVRAVDVNGNVSNKILTVNFDIATPFWKAIWFWLIVALVAQAGTIYFVNRRQKKRKEIRLAKEIENVQTAALEQQAFTSLMNPHFMFNALNSIQHYMNMRDRQNTNRYLSDFASLIRKNFEAAQQSFIPLEQEIENIKIYLRLEQMRFNDRFAYQIIANEKLDTDEWMVPTMILQPLLENALLHGIMPSAIDGKIIIDLKEKDDGLQIIITDNGIGVANSMALKEATGAHKSRGMELIKKRIAALSRFGPQAITILISPAFVSEKNPGNKIILFVPHELHNAWVQARQ